ncbi:MAG: hypothetical protein ACI9LG_003250, partial [Moritella dasanensis]
MITFVIPQQAQVISIDGQAVHILDQQNKPLENGYEIAAGGKIEISSGAQVILKYADGSQVIIDEHFKTTDNADTPDIAMDVLDEITEASDKPTPGQPQVGDDVLAEIRAIQELILSDEESIDPVSTAAGSTSNGVRSSAISVERTGDETLAQAEFETEIFTQAGQSKTFVDTSMTDAVVLADTAITEINIDVAGLLADANTAADFANEAIAAANEAADTLAAIESPTADDIVTAQAAVDTADSAIADAATVATYYEDAATTQNETVEDTTSVNSTDPADSAIATATTEMNTDADVADLWAAANTAADTANEAIAAANTATRTLADIENLTAADIATAQAAVTTTDAAIVTANNATKAYTDEAATQDETAVATTSVGNTDAADSAITTATTEMNTDADVADLWAAANTAADTANEAIAAANTATTTLADIENPTAADIATAQA